jgi:hypothetical protein
MEDRYSCLGHGLVSVLSPASGDDLHLARQFIGVGHHHPDGPRPPGPDPAPAPDQPLGVEQGQFDFDLVEFAVWGRGVLEAQVDGFGEHGETSLGREEDGRGEEESKTGLAYFVKPV